MHLVMFDIDGTLTETMKVDEECFVRSFKDVFGFTDGYIPEARALLCRKEWTQLNYGWWTLLEPHLTDTYKKETEAARQQARKDLEDENKALRGQHVSYTT